MSGSATAHAHAAAGFARDCRDVLACAVEAARADGPATDPAIRATAARLLADDPSHPSLAEIGMLAQHVTSRPIGDTDR